MVSAWEKDISRYGNIATLVHFTWVVLLVMKGCGRAFMFGFGGVREGGRLVFAKRRCVVLYPYWPLGHGAGWGCLAIC